MKIMWIMLATVLGFWSIETLVAALQGGDSAAVGGNIVITILLGAGALASVREAASIRRARRSASKPLLRARAYAVTVVEARAMLAGPGTCVARDDGSIVFVSQQGATVALRATDIRSYEIRSADKSVGSGVYVRCRPPCLITELAVESGGEPQDWIVLLDRWGVARVEPQTAS
jgi:hypothetical protein